MKINGTANLGLLLTFHRAFFGKSSGYDNDIFQPFFHLYLIFLAVSVSFFRSLHQETVALKTAFL